MRKKYKKRAYKARNPRFAGMSKEYLTREYAKKGREIKDIAAEFGVSYRSTWQRIMRFGILIRKANRRLNLLGKTFGHLTVIGFAGIKNGASRWKARCVCGLIKVYKGHVLNRTGRSSCGCMTGFGRGAEHKLWKGHGEISGSMWRKFTDVAAKRGWEVGITIGEAWQLFLKQGRKCAISGIPISFAADAASHTQGGTTASLDRIDSTRGYRARNVQWLHKTVNRMKWDMPTGELLKWCKIIVRHNA